MKRWILIKFSMFRPKSCQCDLHGPLLQCFAVAFHSSFIRVRVEQVGWVASLAQAQHCFSFR